uniref:Uncharacterized protein n=1 Tax=Arundo donax TaxID=35708 RepID=A0A0A9EHB4_ARUDO
MDKNRGITYINKRINLILISRLHVLHCYTPAGDLRTHLFSR